ncbi:hypothetical protein AVEN_34493-1 [Araneus ventricosus]|uniref:Uncharacterized protein n=1 Tax=Araneus ventricosus TaxID=182803 RepID=A0A4Y2Q8C9_ARAVE|nr:hypothetical protein AVEN_34493-1 [Araneus ventricosus]
MEQLMEMDNQWHDCTVKDFRASCPEVNWATRVIIIPMKDVATVEWDCVEMLNWQTCNYCMEQLMEMDNKRHDCTVKDFRASCPEVNWATRVIIIPMKDVATVGWDCAAMLN